MTNPPTEGYDAAAPTAEAGERRRYAATCVVVATCSGAFVGMGLVMLVQGQLLLFAMVLAAGWAMNAVAWHDARCAVGVCGARHE